MKQFPAIGLSIFLAMGCSEKIEETIHIKPIIPEPEKPKATYVAGFTYEAPGPDFVVPNAAYWKNDTITFLPPPVGASGCYASFIKVAEKNIYVAGKSYSQNSEFIEKPLLWKNGVLQMLPIPTGAESFTGCWIGDLQVVDKNVFVTAFLFDGSTPMAVAWKNGNLISLENAIGKQANNIVVDNGNVYVGSANGYWLNGAHTLVGGIVNSIAVSNGTVYLAGDKYDQSNNKFVSGFWKGEEFKELPTDKYQNANPKLIKIQGNDVYILGELYNEINSAAGNTSVLWKNESIAYMWGINNSSCSSFFLAEDQIYVSGIQVPMGFRSYHGTYWILYDNHVKDFLVSKTQGSGVDAIFVNP